MTSLIKQVGLLCIILWVASCKSAISEKENNNEITELDPDYTNKLKYHIKVGDTIRIYHSSRATACDFICTPNLETLNHLKYIEDKLMDTGQSKGCLGCDQIYALTFIAQSTGSDTIIQKKICADEICSDTLTGFSSHIINIE